MSWIHRLYETYERCADAPQFAGNPPWPVGHMEQQAHIEIVLDGNGEFLRAATLKKEPTVVPATEASAGRVGTKPPPHPLCDKVQYCASDYESFGGKKEPFFSEFHEQLLEWCAFDPNPKVEAVLGYVNKGTVVADLVREGILHCGPDGQLLTEWDSDLPTPPVFTHLTKKDGKRDQGDAFVRWRVQTPGDLNSAAWLDPTVQQSWASYLEAQTKDLGLCMLTGEFSSLASSHPKRLRHAADGAKLISSNDLSGFTFRGRFELSRQAYGLGSVVSQKAHSALRWLIGRQGHKNGDQVVIAWSVSGKPIPDPLADTATLFGLSPSETEQPDVQLYAGDVGQHYALRLSRAIGGFRPDLDNNDDIVVMGLDSATPGRMAISFYRELKGFEFLDRLLSWHSSVAWPQNHSKNLQFTGAPSPGDVAVAAFGRRLDDKLRKSTVERLLPCIIDSRPLPRDIVTSVVRRTCNRVGLDNWEWEKCLGIACALVRGSQGKGQEYKMSLETDRTTRDYLFGRLLAIAENIEQRALFVANERRETNAAKLMQRFSTHPSSTWRILELALVPYKARLGTSRPSVLMEREKLLDEVMNLFAHSDFVSDSNLSGEFLLAYHCQRAALWSKDKPAGVAPEDKTAENTGDQE